MRLDRLIARQSVGGADGEGLCQACATIVGGPDGPHLPGLDQVGKGLQGLFEGRFGVVLVGLIEIDDIDLQARQALVAGGHDVGAR